MSAFRFCRLRSTHSVRFSGVYPSGVCCGSRRPALVATQISSCGRSFFNCATSRSLRPSPYTSAVSMKFTPASTAACSAANESRSSTGPHALPMAHAPKLMVDTDMPVRPKGL